MDQLFKKVQRTKTIKALDSLVEKYPEIKKIVQEFEKKYPRLGFKITDSEIEKAFKKRKITKNHLIDLESGNFSVLEKVLIAALWKNGQITRVQSIMDGITGRKTSQTLYGVVFNQFGRSLAADDEPIVDQHVLRAFSTYNRNLSSLKGRKKIPKGSAMRTSDQELINAYRVWIKKILGPVSKEDQFEFRYKLDKILFAIGKILGKSPQQEILSSKH